EFAPDQLYVDLLTLVRERRIASGYEQPPEPPKTCDDVLGEAVSEILLLTVVAEIRERQDGQRRLVRKSKRGSQRSGHGTQWRPVCRTVLLAHGADKADAFAGQRLDQALFLAVVSDRNPSSIDAAGQGRV